MNRGPEAPGTMIKETAPIQALQEKVYRRLKERIINCEMLPGAVISEDLLAGDFGTSRTPIREALLRLQRENLVVIFPRQGTFVSQISLKDIYEVYQIRQIIEPRVARLVCRSLDPEVLEKFRSSFKDVGDDDGSFLEWCKVDREFHNYILERSNNRHLVQLYGTIMDQSQRMRVLAGRLPMRMAETNREHLELVDALLSKNEERIEKVMTAHILASRDGALKIDGFIHD